jgi:hypothetical protein
MAWVKIERSDSGGIGDSVYAGGNYAQPAGRVGSPLVSDAGTRTFETLGEDGNPNWGATAEIDPPADNSRANPIAVTLQPVAVV